MHQMYVQLDVNYKEGRMCDTFGETRHFTRSPLCKKTKPTSTINTTSSEDTDVEHVERLHANTPRRMRQLGAWGLETRQSTKIWIK